MFKTLLIDNYDSFTHIIEQYVWMISGHRPLLIKNDALSISDLQELSFDNIVISPGPGHPGRPEDVGICRQLFDHFPDTPILGVCLGHQLMAHHFGADITHAPQPMHGKYSTVALSPSPLFEGIPEKIEVVRYHSLVVKEAPKEFEVVAHSLDDEQIMAIQHRNKPWFGVQFHPESVGTSHGMEIIRNFLNISEKWHPQKMRENQKSSRMFKYISVPWVEPETVFECCFLDKDHAFWLDSSLTGRNARFSFMGTSEKVIALERGKLSGNIGSKVENDNPTPIKTFFDRLNIDLDKKVTGSGTHLPFKGGWVGYFSYEFHQHLFEHSPKQQLTELAYPEALFLWVDHFIAFDHQNKSMYLCSISPEKQQFKAWTEHIKTQLNGAIKSEDDLKKAVDFTSSFEPELRRNKKEYVRDILDIQQLIRDGESYEVCLTNEFKIKAEMNPYRLYRILRQTNPAPYSAFFKMPETSFLSSSPECLFRLDEHRSIISEPMKGTRPMGQTPEETEKIKRELLTSTKDHSELLMIIDLIRNDLSMVCQRGTVEVREKIRLSEYATVLQTSSIIEGQLMREKNALDIIKALFPGGSITGAPKLRTMQIIDRFEQRPRGIYTGSIGYFSVDGQAEFNIAIRTMVYDELKKELTFGSGGAILAESAPEEEFEEILVKAYALVRAANISEQISLEQDAVRH